MKGFDTLHIKSAVKARNQFDLSRTHLTTMNFGEIVPLFSEETVPGDDITIHADYFSRMAPLVKPTYGKFQFKTMTSFVPYHQVAEDFEGWIAGKTSIEGETPRFRHFTMDTLVNFYIYGLDSSLAASAITIGTATTVASSANCDFNYVTSAGTAQYRLFTTKGKYVNKVLNSLGYSIPQGINFQTGSTWYKNEAPQKLSAYPLLAFFKAYNDYMSQATRFNSSLLSRFLRSVKQGKTIDGYDSSTGALGWGGLSTLFGNLFLCYDNDYFTSAWRYANSALGIGTDGFVNSAEVPATSGIEFVAAQNNYNTLTTYNSQDPQTTFSQRALDWLKSFDSWVKRNNYSGSRAVQQIYSRFGIKTDDFRTHYAHVLGTDSMPIQVGDVTSTSDATGANLGQYAGKGIMNGNGSVKCKADDYGLLVVLGWYTVTPMNAYGFDRKVLRNQPLDYYNPEFDGIGADAISAGEYFSNPTVKVCGDTTSDLDVYGYTERYNAYRFGRDMITGEFRKYRNDDGMNVWHTGRLLTDVRQSGYLAAQAPSIVSMPQIESEYNRIFSITDGSVDTFYLTAQFKVDAQRPMLNFNQVPQLGEGDTVVPRNGNTIN